MNSTTLQIPMKKQLRDKATSAAEQLGFTSLQEIIRVFLKKLALKKISVSFEEEAVVHLSAKAARRYDKMIDDIESGKEKVYSTKNVDDLMKQLRS